jgi:hypothetical protein
MKIPSRLLGVCLISWVCALPLQGFADTPDKPVQPKHPAKAAPRAPLSKPQTVDTVVSPVSKPLVKPTKPPVITAVAPKQPIGPAGAKSGIIFVGGKPVGGNYGALNPQPIPPGRPVPVDPIHRD